MGPVCSSEIWPSRVHKVFALLIFQTSSTKILLAVTIFTSNSPTSSAYNETVTVKRNTIANLILRVVDIPLTEASDSPKIAAWHMTPTEVRRHLLYKHSQVICMYVDEIQQERKSNQRCKLYSIFCRKKPADLLCCIFTGWLTLGDIRTESISTRLGTKGTTVVIIL